MNTSDLCRSHLRSAALSYYPILQTSDYVSTLHGGVTYRFPKHVRGPGGGRISLLHKMYII